MAPLETILADAALGASLLSSVVLANGWGEVSAGPEARGPSLSVLGSALVFTPVRWLLALLALALAMWHGAFHGRFGTDPLSWSLVVGAHAVLGVLSLWWLDAGVRRIHRDRGVPRLYALLGGVLLPLPVLVVAAVGCNEWLGAGPRAFAICTIVVFVAHFVSYRAGCNARPVARPIV